MLREHGIACDTINKQGEGRPDILDAITNGEIDFVINTPSSTQESAVDDSYIRKAAIKAHVPYMTTLAAAMASALGIPGSQGRERGKRHVAAGHPRYDRVVRFRHTEQNRTPSHARWGPVISSEAAEGGAVEKSHYLAASISPRIADGITHSPLRRPPSRCNSPFACSSTVRVLTVLSEMPITAARPFCVIRGLSAIRRSTAEFPQSAIQSATFALWERTACT